MTNTAYVSYDLTETVVINSSYSDYSLEVIFI